MQIDFDNLPSVNDLTSVPPGTYVVEVAEVRPGTTRNGDERWGMRLVIAEGDFVGRHAAWDGLVFSPKGNARVQRVFAALGLPTEGVVDVQTTDLVGRRALVTLRLAEFEHPSGQKVRRHEVPYDGYRALPRQAAEEDGQELPF